MDRSWILGGLLVAAGGYGLARAITYRPPITSDSRILLIGDSLACGLSPHLKMFAKEAKVPFESHCLNGSRIDQWADSSNLGRYLAQKPTHVLISLGTNDEYSMLKKAFVLEKLHGLIKRIKASGAHIIWIGAPRLEKNRGIVDAIRPVTPYYFDSRNYQIPRGPDKLHPTIKGFAGWAALIWNWLH